jgi:multisubunit Na+/H+ antiporter MnhG subunit
VNVHEVVVHVLVWAAVVSEVVCCVGIVAARGVYARLHYAAASTSLAPVLVAVAIAVEEGVRSIAAAAALVVAAFLVLGNPALTIATARAARARGEGDAT